MIDSHCHLADEAFAGDLDGRRRAGAGRPASSVPLCILAAGDAARSRRPPRASRALWPGMRFATGIHPHHAGQFAGRRGETRRLSCDAASSRVAAVAIGEIGLDYHYDFSPRDVQQEVFRRAGGGWRCELGLPVMIHTREATDDTFRILRDAGRTLRGVFHCFTGDVAMARQALDLGFYISLAGIVTFPKAETLREVATLVPADRLLIETDAPYLAPVPHRGKRNEPAFVARVVETVAGLRGVPAAELGRAD